MSATRQTALGACVTLAAPNDAVCLNLEGNRMKNVRKVIAALALALPIAAVAATQAADSLTQTQSAPAGIAASGGQSYLCCWVLFMGKWYCLPCG